MHLWAKLAWQRRWALGAGGCRANGKVGLAFRPIALFGSCALAASHCVQAMFVHPRYVSNRMAFDVGLIQLLRPIPGAALSPLAPRGTVGWRAGEWAGGRGTCMHLGRPACPQPSQPRASWLADDQIPRDSRCHCCRGLPPGTP